MKRKSTESKSLHVRSIGLLHRFLKGYYPKLAFLSFLSFLPGLLLGLRPLVLAPVLGQMIPSDSTPAGSIRELTLDNIGVSLQNWIGSSGDLGHLFFMAATAYLLITLIAALLSGFANVSALSVRLQVYDAMVRDFHRHLTGLDIRFFTHRQPGDLVSHFTVDLAKTASAVDGVLMGLVQSGAQALVCAYILFRTEPKLSFFVLVIGSFHLLLSRVMGGWVRKRTSVAFNGQAALSATLMESLQSVRLVKAFTAEDFDRARVATSSRSLRHFFFRYMVSRYIENPARLLADGFVVSAILGLCHFAIKQDTLTMAGMALFFYIASQLVLPMSDFSRRVLTFYSLQGGISRLLALYDTKSRVVDGAWETPRFEHSLRMSGVDFSYQEGEAVLADIEFEVKRGETVAIVGPSGSGKSTAIDLILRLYDPVNGSIKIDEHDIREYDQNSYRSQFGVVSQECFLYNATIKQNILLGRSYEEGELQRAVQIANIEEMIENLPEGYDTMVGERGVRLSGGQRQRIAIARAVFGHPQILVLDEATSALDTESERAVQAAIDHALTGLTGIVIAHRLSTIVRADKIVVFDQGHVVGVGPHEQLLKECPVYQNLYQLQFSD